MLKIMNEVANKNKVVLGLAVIPPTSSKMG